MAFREEPEYQVFAYQCIECGAEYREAGSVKLHRSRRLCPKCEALKVVEKLTGMETDARLGSTMKGSG